MQDKEWLDKVIPVKVLVPNLTYGDGNWINGTLGKFKFCAKVFSEPSTFGIQDGHISKIQVCDVSQEHWGFDACYINYDRGWDVRPEDPKAIKFMNKLLAAFGDDELGDEDLSWWDIYGYEDQEAFDNLDREHICSLDSKADALEEAQAYLDADDEPYTIMKVRQCGEDGDEEIIRNDGKSS